MRGLLAEEEPGDAGSAKRDRPAAATSRVRRMYLDIYRTTLAANRAPDGATLGAVSASREPTVDAHVRDLRTDAADGRALGPLLAERRRGLRRRVPALPGARRSSTAGSRRARPTTPMIAPERRRRASGRRPRSASGRGAQRPRRRRSRPSRSCAASPSRELAIVEAADLFNATPYRRTVGGIAKSLGEPRVSIVPLSGVNPRARRHRRLGDLVVPVPRHAGLGAARPARRARARSRRARGHVRAVERAPRRRRPSRSGHRAPLRTSRLPTIRDRDLLRHPA